MNGTRQGDFSRLLFDRRKHYSSVYLQQGRVLLDSDWNAQMALTRYRQATETVDAIGASGAPAAAAGFGLEIEGCLELGPGGHFVTIGGSEGCTWAEPPPTEAGFTVEASLLPRGDGVIFSRWARREGGFELADLLAIDDGRLRFTRAGQPDLVSEPLDLVGRRCRVTLATRVDVTTFYVDGEPVVEEASGFPGQELAHNHFLIAATMHDNQPARQLDCLLFGLRLWGVRRTPAEIRRGPGQAAAGAGRRRAADQDLLGDWPLREGAGPGLRDHSAGCNHGTVQGEGPPRWRPYRATVSAGRYYVDGILCENEATVAFEAQPDHPGADFPRQPGVFLFYLDVWERAIGAIEDPELRETALGGPDTTLRARSLAQVKALPVAPPAEDTIDPRTLPEWLQLLAGERLRGRLRARCRPFVGAALGNDLYRVEIHHGGGCFGGRRPVDGDGAAEVSEDGRSLRLGSWRDGFAAGQAIEVYAPEAEQRPGELAVIAEIDAPDRRLDLDRPLELRGGACVRRLATFKWSRQNAALSFPIAKLETGARVLALGASAHGLGEVGELCAGGWVEVVDDVSVLRQEVGHLCRVEAVDGSSNEVTLTRPPPPRVGTEPEHHPLLRVWDQTADGELSAQGLRLARAGWHDLEEGVQVLFEGDDAYRSGDYWWLPARKLAQDIEWPRDDDEPLALAPAGVAHRYAPLALLTHGAEGFRLDDLRRTFQPMVAGSVSKAGDVMEGRLAIRSGLEVEEDLDVRGQARLGRIYGRLCGHDMVATQQLVDRAVTSRKLAPEVGTVPAGYSLLGPSPTPPPGYANTGSRLTLFPENPQWVDRLEIQSAVGGPFASAEAGGKIYTLLESGDLWEVDPEVGAWRRRSDMPYRRRRFAMTSLAGKLHVVGGLDAADRCCGGNLVYDPATDDWGEAEAMPTARCDLALAVFGGRLHALGGLREVPLLGALFGRRVTARHEVYDPRTDTWSRRRSLPAAACGLAAAAAGNAVHVVGGERRWLLWLWGRIRSRSHQLYHPGSDRWLAERSPLPLGRRDLALVAVGGRLYAVGGRGASGWLADCDRFDPAADLWSSQTPLHEPIDSPGAAALGGVLYVTGARRAPDAPGVLVEECQVATEYHVHRRQDVAATERPGALITETLEFTDER